MKKQKLNPFGTSRLIFEKVAGPEQAFRDDDDGQELGFDDAEPNPTSPGINRAQFQELQPALPGITKGQLQRDATYEYTKFSSIRLVIGRIGAVVSIRKIADHLQILYNGHTKYLTPGQNFILGRDTDQTLPATVSRQHLCIDFSKNNSVRLKDISKNGTYIQSVV